METWSPPNPSEHHGIAMFLSHCKEVEWNYHYAQKLQCDRLGVACMVIAYFDNVVTLPYRAPVANV